MRVIDLTKEEDFDFPLSKWNVWVALKNTEFRCREMAFYSCKEYHLSKILRFFKDSKTSYGLLCRLKGDTFLAKYIESEINKYRQEYGLDGTVKVIDDCKFKWADKCATKPKRNRRISGRVRQNVLMRDNYTCQICGATVGDGAKLEIDHIIPISKGGGNDENNLQVLCRQCNREKHNRTDLLHDKMKLKELKSTIYE